MPRQSTAPARTRILSAKQPLPALPLALLSPPAPSQGGPRQGFRPGLQVNQTLVAPRKIPWKSSGPCAQDGRTHPCSEQWELAGPEKRLAVNYSCQETLDPGPSTYRVKPSIHISVWNEGPHPSGLLPSTFLGGLLLFAKSAGGGPSPLPLPGQNKAGRPHMPSFRWLGRGVLSLTSPTRSAHTRLF